MAEKRSFRLSQLAVLGLAASTGVLVVAGFISLADPASPNLIGACITGFTGIGLFSIFVSMAASNCAQVLWRSPHHQKLRWIAIGCAAVCGLASLAGVYLGDAVVGRHAVSMPPLPFMLGVGFLLTFIKPAMGFVFSACEEVEAAAGDRRDAVLMAKDQRIADLERQLRDASARAFPPLENKGGTVGPTPARADASAAPRAPRPPRALSERPAIVRHKGKHEPSLPLTDEELRRAIDSIVAREGAAVVSINSVAREAAVLFDRRVPPKRVEKHPLRHDLFRDVKLQALQAETEAA